jgi:cell wall-associated NlpC family hydrolase
MSEYDSQRFNLFRMPLLWFLVAAISAQMFIAFNSPDSVAAPRVVATPSAVAAPAPQIYGQSLGAPPPVPVKVELPARQQSRQTIVKAKPAPVVTPSPPVRATSSIESVIQFAMAQRGKPYKWAAAGPNSYDCSGLVMVAFAKIGIKLPHYTKTMVGYGKAVSRGALQRGDIVFPSNHHVAIYLGDGMMIHAPQTGDVVKVSKVYAFYAGRRLV